MKYTILGYKKHTSWDEVYFEIEATSPIEALKEVLENPQDYEVSSVGVDDSYSADYNAQDEWRVLNY